ncbi:obtusifoliol 14-alpha demethylase-like [Triticum aestivum]|uniref:obtusifoliol 14-alpha demethylase-like n=1 Tax=Triticum aestivum TaxID=4565 RepID=UPI001D0318BE|nr:obtusifoliol 14-alpha demethylase-like [Triticum aestivum]
MATGAPLLGILLALHTKGPLQVIRDTHAEMGSVFTVRLLHRKVTFLVGPDVSSHFFQGLDSEISQDQVSQFTIPTFGPGVAFDVDFATRREQFRFFGDAMKPAKLRTYARLMVQEVEDFFAKWGPTGTVDLKQELEHLVTLVASRCLFGEEVRAKMLAEVATHLRELNDGMRLVTILFPHLQIPAHRRRDTARARLDEIFSGIVSSRKTSYPDGGPNDMLQCLIDSSKQAPARARLLVRANANHLHAAVQEQERIMERHGDRVDYEVLQEMETLHRCIKEVLRLHPPAMMLLRHARRSFTVQTKDGDVYEVPEGRTVASPLVIHNRLPHVYRDPERYEPDRFGPIRGEDGAGGAFA